MSLDCWHWAAQTVYLSIAELIFSFEIVVSPLKCSSVFKKTFYFLNCPVDRSQQIMLNFVFSRYSTFNSS